MWCDALCQFANEVVTAAHCLSYRALHYASQHGLVSVVQLLLNKGANTALPDDSGEFCQHDFAKHTLHLLVIYVVKQTAEIVYMKECSNPEPACSRWLLYYLKLKFICYCYMNVHVLCCRQV